MNDEEIDELLITIVKEFVKPANFERIISEQVLANAIFYSFAVGRLKHADFTTCYKAYNDQDYSWCKDRQTDQQNRRENPNIDSGIYRQPTLQVQRQFSGERIFNKWYWNNWMYAKKNEFQYSILFNFSKKLKL